MPESLKELRRRVRSIKNTRQITKAMEMVSASKLKRCEGALLAARPYSERLTAMLSRLVASGATPDDPLFETREVKTRLVVAFAADRGLCGAYNANMFKLLEQYIAKSQAADVEVKVMPVGKRMTEYVNKKHPELDTPSIIAEHGGKVNVDLARKIADDSIAIFKDGGCDEVIFLYSHFVSTVRSERMTEKFLPFDIDAFASTTSDDEEEEIQVQDYIYEPSADKVFESLLPRFIQSRSYVAFASALTSEHAARMMAMNNATKNCGELIDQLTLRLNKARQAQITTEIIEIVSGADALGA
jgi:F-type H+-transporting ATPase subunit gamma